MDGNSAGADKLKVYHWLPQRKFAQTDMGMTFSPVEK
jgi:hypothetical protein